jgi:hypothetical protein
MVQLKKFKTENLLMIDDEFDEVKTAKHRNFSRQLFYRKIELWDEVEINSYDDFYPFLRNFNLAIRRLTKEEVKKHTNASNGKRKHLKTLSSELIKITSVKIDKITKSKKLDEIEKLEKHQIKTQKSCHKPLNQTKLTDQLVQSKRNHITKYIVIHKKDHRLKLKSILVTKQKKLKSQKKVRFSDFEYIRYYDDC